MATIREWTGRESHALREAMRLSQRDFANQLGVNERLVSKWEAGGADLVPRPNSQAILDTKLRQVSDEERDRFKLILSEDPIEVKQESMTVIGTRLKAARKERFWTARKMAEMLRGAADNPGELPHIVSLVRMIRNWEIGDRKPSETYRLLYCKVFGKIEAELFNDTNSAEEIAASSEPAGGASEESSVTAFGLAPKNGHSATNLDNENFGQLEALRQHIDDALSRGIISNASLDDWERSVIRYGRATRDRPPNILLTDISGDLAELTRLLNQRNSASALRRLTRVSSQMSGLICLIFCLLDNRPEFRRWARTATIAANEAGDSETLSWILAQVAHGYYYGGEISEAIEIANSANEATQIPCVGTALASALAARAYAIQGNKSATLESISRAENILSRLSEDAFTPSAFGYNEASLRFHEGNAFTHLRDVKRALKAQERALALCSRDNYNDWAMTRLDRAQCLIYDGDATGGLAYATETMANLSIEQRQGIITLRGQAILDDLPASERKLVGAHDLQEMLMLAGGESEDRQ